MCGKSRHLRRCFAVPGRRGARSAKAETTHDQISIANVGNDVHGLQTAESRVLALSHGFTNDLTLSVRLPWIRRTDILEAVQ